MTQAGVTAVLLDMDGLMFDTEHLAKEAWLQVGRETGYPIGESVLARIRGATPAASAEIFRDAFGTGFSYPDARARRSALVEEQIRRDGVPVKPGLMDLLRGLRERDIPAAVASSSPRALICRYLKQTGTDLCISAVVSGEDVTRSKPAPDIFLTAASRLSCPPENCLVLEDSANGLLAARAAGMRSICVPDLALPDPSALDTCAAVLPSLDQVLPWLENAGLL